MVAPLATDHPGHRSGRGGPVRGRRSPIASAATRSARSPARSRCSRTRCAITRSSTARSSTTPQARTGRQEQMAAEIARFGADIEATLVRAGAHFRADAVGVAASSRPPPTTQRTALPARPPPPATPRPMCATSPRRPTSWRHRSTRSIGRSRSRTPSPTKAVDEAERTNVDRQRAQRGGRPDRRRGQPDHRHRRADQPAWRSTPRSRRRARAMPAAASRSWRARSRRWPARPPRRPRISRRRSPACSRRPRARSRRSARSSAPSATSATSRGAIAAAVTEQGAATQEIARSVETASQAHDRDRRRGRAGRRSDGRDPQPCGDSAQGPSPTISARSPRASAVRSTKFFEQLRAA